MFQEYTEDAEKSTESYLDYAMDAIATRVFYWKEEPEERQWKVSHDIPEEKKAAIDAGAMFFTSTLFSEPHDEQKPEPLRYGDFVLDFDSKDNPEKSLQDLRTLCLVYLPEQYGLDPNATNYFASGSKGFHAVIPSECLGAESGDQFLPLAYKKLVAGWKETLGLETLDMSLYCMGRGKMFRLPNVKRSNNRYKIPLSLEEVRTMDMDQITAMTMQPREIKSVDGAEYDCPDLAQEFRKILFEVHQEQTEHKNAPPIDPEMMEHLIKQVAPCITYIIKDCSKNKRSTFNKLTMILVEYFQATGFTIEDALNLVDHFLQKYPSTSYTTFKKRLAHFKMLWSYIAGHESYRFSCNFVLGIGYPWSAFECKECPLKHDKSPSALIDSGQRVQLDDIDINSEAFKDGRLFVFDSKKITECFSKNQIGDAELFRELHRDRFIYDHAAGQWYQWAGHYWVQDKTEAAVAAVQEVTKVYLTESDRISRQINEAKSRNPDTAMVSRLLEQEKAFRKRIQQLQVRSRINDVLMLARVGPDGLGTPGDSWDIDPMLFCCKNGVVDLTDGSFRPGRPTDMIKTVAPVEWCGIDEPAPVWEKTITDIFPEEVINYFQSLIGYCMTGKVIHHLLVMCHGTGSNGKSLLFETIGNIFGGYAYQIPSETLLASSRDSGGGQSRSDIMALRGRRLCFSQEISSSRSLDLAKSKMLTGNDTISARELYGKQTTFRPTWKIFMITNNAPKADSCDRAIWRRLVLLPFEQSFVENPTGQNERLIDYELPEKLNSEYSGILAWAVRGCLKWQAKGLQPPDKVKMATAEYKTENDTIGQFITDFCIVGPELRIQPADLYVHYEVFCNYEGLEQNNKQVFYKQLKSRFKSERDNEGRWYLGIAVKPGWDIAARYDGVL